jgi:hypothetical protein
VYDVRGALAELIHKLLGERPNVQVEIDGVNPLPNNKYLFLFSSSGRFFYFSPFNIFVE